MNPKLPEARAFNDNPFLGMKISDSSQLNLLKERSSCCQCGKSRMYFCYTCYVPVLQLVGSIPYCKLPVKVDIIKHRHEIDGKSTAAHAAILAREDVTIYTYPDIPVYNDDGRTVLLYPGSTAQPVCNLFNKKRIETFNRNENSDLPHGFKTGTLMTNKFNNEEHNTEIYHVFQLPIDRVILIDSTWSQSRGIFSDIRLQKVPLIVLQNRASQFWRYQKGSPRWYLSTIEALHELLLELHICAWGRHALYSANLTQSSPVHSSIDVHPQCAPYNGQYDDLLYFFKYLYEKIHTLYRHEDMQSYKRLV